MKTPITTFRWECDWCGNSATTTDDALPHGWGVVDIVPLHTNDYAAEDICPACYERLLKARALLRKPHRSSRFKKA
jgi:hypothetical protein